MPQRTLCAALLGCVSLLHAVNADYLDQLKEKVPYYRTMTGRFAPLYPAFAKQMVQDYGLKAGVAVDVGSSCGGFAMELARQTAMKVYAIDIDTATVRLCGALVDQAELTGRVVPLEGDALDLPLRDNFADFVFSRGSIPFWPDQVQGLKECYRHPEAGRGSVRRRRLRQAARPRHSGGTGQGPPELEGEAGWVAGHRRPRQEGRAGGPPQVPVPHGAGRGLVARDTQVDLGAPGLRGCGQHEREPTPLPRFALHGDPAAVAGDHPLDDGQPKAGAAGLPGTVRVGPVEPLEQVR